MKTKEPEKIVLPDDPEAATLRTVTGWVSRLGHFYGAGEQGERIARYDGSTHTKCETCGEVHRKSAWCETCRERRKTEEWTKLVQTAVVWDEEAYLALHDDDTYFFDIDEIASYLDDNPDVAPEDLRLVLTEGRKLREVELDYWQDDLPGDGDDFDLPDAVQAALTALNAAIAAEGPVSWWPGKQAVVLSPETIATLKRSE